MPLSTEFLTRIRPYDDFIWSASHQYSVRTAIIKAIIFVESSGIPTAEAASTTARGLMQITQGAAKDMGYEYSDLFDPESNILCGTKYLAHLINSFNGDEYKGIMAYYAGRGTIHDNKLTQLDRDAEAYARKVYACLA